MKHNAISTIIGAATITAAAGLATVTALAACGTGSPSLHQPAGAKNSQYRYYLSMMGRYQGGSMMGGVPGGWMMGPGGYRWMTGARGVPGWMRGGHFPGYMTGAGADPGKIMGRFWADSPGPRVSPAQGARLGRQLPAGAQVNRAAKTISFTTTNVHFAVLASPAGGPDETFRIAGLVNPKLVVPAGARVSIEVVNADRDTAHGLVIADSQGVRSYMPMMTTRPAFAGSALWFLGDPTGAGMHAGMLRFTAATPGTYRYFCAVPDHALKGMTGMFIVSGHTT
jgi:rusticyanin